METKHKKEVSKEDLPERVTWESRPQAYLDRNAAKLSSCKNFSSLGTEVI